MKTIKLSGRNYELYWVTGNVLDAGKNMETRVSGGGGTISTNTSTGSVSGSIQPVSSTTTVHDQIFIQDDTGKEHSYQLQNFDVACRAGNRLSVIWAIKSGKKSGDYFAVINHSTSKTFYNQEATKEICKPIKNPGWTYFILFILVCVVSYYLVKINEKAFANHVIQTFMIITVLIVYLPFKTQSNIRKLKVFIQTIGLN